MADKLGRQCIHISAQSGHLTSLKYMVNEQKIDINDAADHSGMTPLHIAAKVGLEIGQEGSWTKRTRERQ